MKINETGIQGCIELKPTIFIDDRGLFVKNYLSSSFELAGFDFRIAEQYYSVSGLNVLRGLHFQKPPFESIKLVTAVAGEVLDVVLDLRKNAGSYGNFVVTKLSSGSGNSIIVPSGCAHGIFALTEGATITCASSVEFKPNHEGGILWNSIGFDWPVSDPVLSEKDKNLPALADFESMFE